VAAIDVNLEVIGPALIRLGWHSAATYSAKEVPHGGSNGATMRFEPEIGWEDNAGLNVRRERERARVNRIGADPSSPSHSSRGIRCRPSKTCTRASATGTSGARNGCHAAAQSLTCPPPPLSLPLPPPPSPPAATSGSSAATSPCAIWAGRTSRSRPAAGTQRTARRALRRSGCRSGQRRRRPFESSSRAWA
jgi:hypothetical protein